VGYDITPTSLLYADTATAFRAGGYSYGPGASANPAVGPVFEPEHVTSYEIGLKNRFLDRKLQVNLEAWIYHYTNFENVLVFFSCAPGGGACGGLPGITTADAGRANYHGATIDIDYLLTPLDEVKFNTSWLYARYGNYVQRVAPGYSLSPGPAVTSNDFLSDTYLSNVPKYTGIASYTHTWPNVLGGSVSGQVAAQFQGRQQLDLEDDPVYGIVQYNAPSWVMADLSVKYEPQNSKWGISAYVHNVANRLVPVAGQYSTTTNAFTQAFYPPRVVGVIVSAKF
jgi:iron complex outermembrane receptor protein